MSAAAKPLTPAGADVLLQAGLAADAVAAWRTAAPRDTADYATDCERYSLFWRHSRALLGRLPGKAKRSAREAAAAEEIQRDARETRHRFLTAHTEAVYDRLTDSRRSFVRVEKLVYDAAALVPGLTPAQDQVAVEAGAAQRDKDGVEIDQGIFLQHVLASPRAGGHLCHAMLLPRHEA